MDRHDFDLISFLFGLVFAGLGGAWLITEEALNPDLREWFWPLVLILGGAIVLSSAMSSQRARRRADSGPNASPIED